MKEIVVLSGKGGMGKTYIVASFAALAQSKVLADCDVGAADLHLLLKPVVKEEKSSGVGKSPLSTETSAQNVAHARNYAALGPSRILKSTPSPVKGVVSAIGSVLSALLL